MTDADWQRMLDLNLAAPFRCLRRAIPRMRVSGYGRIVVVASVAAKIGEPYVAAYTASKHGVLGLFRSAAAELAATGVRLMRSARATSTRRCHRRPSTGSPRHPGGRRSRPGRDSSANNQSGV
jgi:NAD(P)-dependent dehydrogenase (short-subunit alcohol dehydrogenase family)